MNYFFILLLWALPLQAELKSVIKISDSSFNQSVRPLLESMNHDFFDLYELTSGERKEPRNLSSQYRKIKTEINYIKKVCPVNPLIRCKASFEVIQSALRVIDEQLTHLSKNTKCQSYRFQSCPIISNILENEIVSLYRARQNLMLSYASSGHQKIFLEFIKDIDLAHAYHHGFMAQTLPETIYPILFTYYTSFIQPTDSLIIPMRNGKTFNNWVDRLNFAVNEFHLNLEQKQKLIPAQYMNKASEIHGKWNGWLRSLLQ